MWYSNSIIPGFRENQEFQFGTKEIQIYDRRGLIKPCSLEFDLEISIICIKHLLKKFLDLSKLSKSQLEGAPTGQGW